jgi:large subunit ribosomal protein L24
MQTKCKIKKGDLVKVISGGKDIKGQSGKVLEVLRDGDKVRVRVEGLRIIKRHLKPQRSAKHPEGGIIEGAGSIPLSHVMLFSETLNRPVRVGAAQKTGEGKASLLKERVARGKGLKAEKV